MTPLRPDEIDKQLHEFHTEEYGLHPDAPHGCTGEIIRAHTLHRRGQIDQIARDGHVYGVDRRYLSFTKGRSPFKPNISVYEASTFRFFCGDHDRATFSPIETKPIVFTPEQCFLLGYRALCRDVYLSRQTLKEFPPLREQDRGRPLAEQRQLQARVTDEEQSRSRRLAIVEKTKVLYDAVLQERAFSDIRFSRIEIQPAPEFLVSSACLPLYDFAGQRIPQHPLTASLIALPQHRGALVFAWHRRHGEKGHVFVDSHLRIPAADVPHAITRLVFTYFENSFWSPAWWERVPSETRSALEQRFVSGMRGDDASSLKDDGLRAVSWTVKPLP